MTPATIWTDALLVFVGMSISTFLFRRKMDAPGTSLMDNATGILAMATVLTISYFRHN